MKVELILISVLLLLATVACVIPASPVEPPSARTPYPVISIHGPPNGTATPLPTSQKEAALDIVASSAIVEQVNGSQDWEAYKFWATEINGVSVIEVYLRWELPVESAGPWQSLVCRMTRVAVTPALIRDITRLQVLVDLHRGTVRELTPVIRDNHPEHSKWDGPLPVWAPFDSSATVEVYDFKSGAMIKNGTAGDFQVQQDLCGPGPDYGAHDPVHFLTRAYSERSRGGDRTMFPPIYAHEPTPDTGKHETVLDILEMSGLVEAVNGDQSWRTERFIDSVTADHIVLINVQWETPVKTDGPFRRNICGGTKIFERPVLWGNVTTLLVGIDIDLKQVVNLDPDSPTRSEGLTWDEERQRAPQLLEDETGSFRLAPQSMAEEIVTVYNREDWTVYYKGAWKNMLTFC